MVRSVAKELEEAKSATLHLPANLGFLVPSSVLEGKKNVSHSFTVYPFPSPDITEHQNREH